MQSTTALKPTATRRNALELCASGAINTQPYQYTVRKALGELKDAGLVSSHRDDENKRQWEITIDGKLVLLRWTK
jgi:hypothetical protein